MFTLDEQRKQLLRNVFIYILVSLFCVLFGAVYEKFSHGVYSYKMIYAFTAPLVLGAVPFLGMALHAKKLPGSFSKILWNFGIATLTVGLMFHGVLDIYGTTSKWIWVYYIAQGILLIAGLISYLCIDRKRQAP